MAYCTDCNKPVRARGLCSTHYNQRYQPGRHRKVEVPCGFCGRPCRKDPTQLRRYASAFCSIAHRDAAWPPGAASCKVYFHDCLTCGRCFASRARRAVCCSSDCLALAERLTRPAPRLRERAPLRPVECAWCGVQFITNQPAQGYCQQWCARRASKVRRRAREHECFGTYSWSDFMRIAQRFAFRCAYCDAMPEPGLLHPDHVVPLSRGGPNTVSNLLPSCNRCNGDKRDLSLAEWAEDRARRGLTARRTSWGMEDRRFMHLTSVLAAV